MAVSIHAPARGATRRPCFAGIVLRIVSIHAPARGATTISSARTIRVHVFQSTRPRGARPTDRCRRRRRD